MKNRSILLILSVFVLGGFILFVPHDPIDLKMYEKAEEMYAYNTDDTVGITDFECQRFRWLNPSLGFKIVGYRNLPNDARISIVKSKEGYLRGVYFSDTIKIGDSVRVGSIHCKGKNLPGTSYFYAFPKDYKES